MSLEDYFCYCWPLPHLGENLMWQARQFQDQRLYEQARNYKMTSCERLQALSV